jgi:putative oxidoreductase
MTLAAFLVIAGRTILGLFFLIAAFRNTIHFRERIPSVTNYGRALPPPVVALGFAMQWVGGLSLLLGLWTVWGALVLIAFLVLATALYHNLFLFNGKERDPHLYFTLVNSALAGALLLVIADAL